MRYGYIVMDGDNNLVEQELAIYSYATLEAADICGLRMLDVVGSLILRCRTRTDASSRAYSGTSSGSSRKTRRRCRPCSATPARVGNEALNWTIADFTNAAKLIKALGFESITVKRAMAPRSGCEYHPDPV